MPARMGNPVDSQAERRVSGWVRRIAPGTPGKAQGRRVSVGEVAGGASECKRNPAPGGTPKQSPAGRWMGRKDTNSLGLGHFNAADMVHPVATESECSFSIIAYPLAKGAAAPTSVQAHRTPPARIRAVRQTKHSQLGLRCCIQNPLEVRSTLVARHPRVSGTAGRGSSYTRLRTTALSPTPTQRGSRRSCFACSNPPEPLQEGFPA